MDDTFGPRLLGHFDFTLLFEHTMFHIIPSSVMIFATPFYVWKIFNDTPVARSSSILWLKIALGLALISIQVANTVLWSLSPLESQLAQATAIISCIGALCISILIYASHIFFLQPLPFLSLFLSVTVLFDIVTTMTYFNRTGLDLIARLHIPIPIIKFVLVCLEEFSKRSLLRSKPLQSSLGQESVAGFWNRSLFVWANSVLFFGFRELLTQGSLPSLSPDFDSESLYRAFHPHWVKANKVSKFALLKACIYTSPWPFLYVVLPRLLSIGFDFAQPFLLQDVVQAVSSDVPPPTDVMRGLILATLIIYVGKAVSKSWYNQLRNQITTSIRGILITAVYHKSLKLSADTLEASVALTLITADVSGIAQLVTFSYDSWARILEMCCGVAILGAFVGAATVFAVVPAVLTSVLSVHIARKIMNVRKDWNTHIETRVATTSNILAQIKDIKMLGLSPSVADRLQKQYEKEVDICLTNRKYVAETMAMSSLAELMTPVLVVAATIYWTRAYEPVTATRLFTTLALVTLVTNPLYFLLHTFGSWSSGLASLNRIQEYLNQAECEDPRKVAMPEHMSANEHPSQGSVSRDPATHSARDIPAATVVLYAVQTTRVSVWAELPGFILTDISIAAPLGGTTMVYGAVGCGKSTLLRTILGEVPIRGGTITLASLSIAYSSQVPWIQNDTIENNVLCGKPLNAVLYQKVIYICGLDVDLAQLAEGDQTLTGSDGCNLSGGQRARISLARSLYSEAELIVLDDVFSAIDAETSATIRFRLFHESDILQSGLSSIIMSTSMKEHLNDADVAYEINEAGKIELFSECEKRRNLEREKSPKKALHASTTPIKPLGAVTAAGNKEQYDPPEAKPATDNAIRDNLSNSKYGDLSLYKYFLGPAGALNVVLWLVITACAAFADRMPPIWVRIWLGSNGQDRFYFAGYTLLSALSCCLYYISPRAFFSLIIQHSSNNLHRELIDTTSHATLEYLAKEDAGALLNRFSQDIAMATQELPTAITPVVWGVYSIIIDISIICAGAKYAIPIIPLFLIVLFSIQHFYLRTSRQIRIMELDSSKSLLRQLTESSTGIEHVRSFQLEQMFAAQLYILLDGTQKPYYLLLAIQQWLMLAMDLTTAGAAVSVVSLALNFRHISSASAMGLALLSLISFSDFTGLTIQSFVRMENTFGAVSRIRDYAKTTPREKDDDSCGEVQDSWPRSGKIELTCVNAVYKPESEKPHKALEDLTLTVQPGETVALVGRTGSGKSSVLLALLHLLEYTGSICIDGQEIRSISRNVLRSRITTITQSGITFKAPVRYNLDSFEPTSAPGYDASSRDALLTKTLQRVGLWSHVLKHGGLDAQMSAMKFSVGQRQIFQLARAILHQDKTKSNIVLMDEATASMDEDTEKRIYDLIMELFADCTKIIISHKDAVFSHADLVLRMADGRGTVEKPNDVEAEGEHVDQITRHG